MTTLKRGNAKLLRLADYVERRQRANPIRSYNQRFLEHGCGAPGCLLGHAIAAGMDTKGFTMDIKEERELFGTKGCNNAGTDWRKAVAYVREFVKRRGGV
jgi:hypothetical protein